MSTVVIEEFVALQKNTLCGFCRVRMPSGVIFHDVSIHRKDTAAWASPASKPMIGRDGLQMRGRDGKGLWTPIVSFASRDIRDKFGHSRHRGVACGAPGSAGMTATEACRLAQNLARNDGYAMFPVGDDKRPMLKGWPERASNEPAAIAALWRSCPGPLIGVVTGHRSGVSVLDVDQKHGTAREWWWRNYARLIPTRCYETRSHGLHIYFQHAAGVTNTQSKICKGVDTRGEGGFAIYWHATGLQCFDSSPPSPWPAWLFAEVTRQPPPPTPRQTTASPEAAITGIVNRVAGARDGERNAVLFWAACRLAERGIHQAEAEALLLPAAFAAGHASAADQLQDRRSIMSAFRRAGSVA